MVDIAKARIYNQRTDHKGRLWLMATDGNRFFMYREENMKGGDA